MSTRISSKAAARTTTVRAARYVRISQDREGAGLGVARQDKDCVAYAKERGWQVQGEPYADNDTSASSDKPRPAWERLLADVKAGKVDAIVVWHVDRMTRRPRELEDVIDLADRYGLQLGTVKGEVDLATPTGRMVARILGAAARHEAEHKAVRQRGKAQELAEAGLPNGGGVRPFGYAASRMEVVEDEAAVIREAAARVLRGETLGAIARDFEARGVVGTRGKPFTAQTLRQVLVAARISGRREYRPRGMALAASSSKLGEIVADAAWPAIISPEDSDRLRKLLSDPARRSNGGGTARKYLLSGMLHCGACGHRLVANRAGDILRYRCNPAAGAPGCGGVSVSMARANEHVRDMLLHVLVESPKVWERLAAKAEVGPGVAQQIRNDEQELIDIAADRASGAITRGEWQTMREIVEARLLANQALVTKATGSDALREFLDAVKRQQALHRDATLADAALAAWEGLPSLDAQRAVLQAAFERLEVAPSAPNAPGRAKWTPERLQPTWRM